MDKISTPIDSEDFGVVGDGMTDDTAALQAFFDAVVGKAGSLQPGTFKISAQITGSSCIVTSRGGRNGSLFLYEGGVTIPGGGAVLSFEGVTHLSLSGIGFRWGGGLTADNRSVGLRLRNCVYCVIDGVTHGGSTRNPGGNRTTGILIEQTEAGFVPPRGNTVLRNILGVVELIDQKGAVLSESPSGRGSSHIHIRGLPGAHIEQILFEGEGNLEHAEHGLKLEHADQVAVGKGWVFRGASSAGVRGVELGLYACSNVRIDGAQIIPTPVTGCGMIIDAASIDTILIGVGWNFSSGRPHRELEDLGSRTTIVAPGPSSGPGKVNGPFEFKKVDGTLPHAEFVRSRTDNQAVMVLRRAGSAIMRKAWQVINSGGDSGLDFMRHEAGETLYTRAAYNGGFYTTPTAYQGLAAAGAELAAGQMGEFLDIANDRLIKVIKLADGSLRYALVPFEP